MSFERYTLSLKDNVFADLHQSAQWEEFSKGRQLAVLHEVTTGQDLIPLVRTTTVYQKSSQPFSRIHETIIEEIRKTTGIQDLQLNNAMLEVYDSQYRTMKFHTDQALDLEPESYICLFSCYEQGEDAYPRTLTVKNKQSEDEFEIQLLHHSVVIFSTDTNQRYLHKIEGRNMPKNHKNRWMGFTLRLSKTFVQFVDGVPHLITSDGVQSGELTIATESESKAFYAYKGQENKEIDYKYPNVTFTISPSDRMPVV